MTLSKSLISPLISSGISLTGLLFDLTMTSIKNLLLQTHLSQTIIALNAASMFQSLSRLPYAGLLGTLITLTLTELSSVSEFSPVEKASQFCDFCDLFSQHTR